MNLNELAKAGLERKLVEYPTGGALIEHPAEGLLLNFSSNDYLGLSRHPAVVAGAQVALLESGCSASASRLVSGSLELHRLLEVELATFLGFESSLVFGSGALANIGVIGSVVGRHDTVIADKLVHATILDGAILSRARLVRFRHNDLAHLRNLLESHGKSSNGRCLVITESVFSMDGDLAPLVEIVALCREFGAMLMVDEAHAIGVFGPSGKGLVSELGLTSQIDLLTGTFSKSLASYGGFVACTAELRRLILNSARTLIYSTGLPPASTGAALAALRLIANTPEWGGPLLNRAKALRSSIATLGFDIGQSASQIIPVLLSDNKQALEYMASLRAQQIIAVAIRPPTVVIPRLRLSLSRLHQPEHVRQLTTALQMLAPLADSLRKM